MPASNRKFLHLALVAAGILLAGGALFTRAAAPKRVKTKPKPVPAAVEKTEPPDTARPLAVMIDNHPAARPQSGVAKAAIVWEAPVEGGLTRLMAVFRSASATEIGPVRSARPYFLSWASEFDAVYAHVGGSDQALQELSDGKTGLEDANEFFNGTSYWRDVRRDAPHNTYTSSERLRGLIEAKAWRPTTDVIDPTSRAAIASGSSSPATRINIVFSANGESEEFRWEEKTKNYSLWRGVLQSRQRDGTAIAPANVVVLEMRVVPIADPQGKGLIGLEQTGSGKATIFRDGKAMSGTWKKPDAKSPTLVYDGNGKLITFARGQIWYAVIAANQGGSVTAR